MDEVFDMNCREYRDGLIEAARGGAQADAERSRLADHRRVCPDCALAFETQVRVSAAAASLAVEAASVAAPAMLESALLAEFDRVRRPRRMYWRLAAAGAMAASLLAAWTLWRQPAPAPVAKTANIAVSPAPEKAPVVVAAMGSVPEKRPAAHVRKAKPPIPQAAQAEPDTEAEFVAIPFTDPLSPYERAEVMRVDLPVSALIAAGFSLPVADPAASARADLVVGEDGRARAVRVIAVSDSSFGRRH